MGVPVVSKVMRKVFGSRNERMVKRYTRLVDQVNAQEEKASALTDADLRAKTEEFKSRIENGEKALDLIPEVFAVAREAMDRSVGIRNIFNPEQNFDPSALPDDARRLYDEVRAAIEAAEPMPPEGDYVGCTEPTPAWMFVDIPNRLYEAVREMYPDSRPPFRARPFDVQIIGGVVLYEGRIAEMKTGEGKTIVAPLASYLAILEDMQVHVVTVNEYLVQRDRDWVFPFYRSLGLTVGAIHPMHMQTTQMKQQAYACNVVYGTTSEFGFDYLRDNMKLSVGEQVQKRQDFAIVDEVDSILIDEARTPLIISGAAHQQAPRYELADKLARHLVDRQKEWNEADQKVQSCLVDISGLEGDIRNARDKTRVRELREALDRKKALLPELEAERDKYTQYYEVEMDKKRATITHEGVEEAQREAGMGSFYVGENIDVPHLLEQSLRAHAVYQRDRDYVVAPEKPGEDPSVIIVDQNTGRKMIGRQWSDGLHQAVEAREGVKIKQETQTMATITIQNFFKLYKRLAGMTGTADTEATEFYEIYNLDVICIPTNVPIERDDRNDLVFLSEKDKWESIVDEIEHFHSIGRPVLVGTTSVEKSELISRMLSRKHNVQHEVLNAKYHEREADIVAGAGQLGAVMIATNMAGRGTDIRLGHFKRSELIDHWKRRGLCPRHVKPEMDDDEIVNACYRHLATKELGLKKGDVEAMSDDEVRLALLRKWALEHSWLGERKISTMDEASLCEALDETGGFLLHNLRMFRNVEELGGLHVVGTERHEARRIDNQLRGRSGRQGDNGSSRFFLSLEDDLMKMFAGETTLKILSKLGMKEGDAIEHPMLSKSVERAQRKVEERNFLWRKNILEYDEIMDVQRGIFYGQRQDVLEGRGIKDLIFEYIEEAVGDAVARYLDPYYVANCVVEWVQEEVGVALEPDRVRRKDREDLHKVIRVDAKEDAAATIDVTLGEYLPSDEDSTAWNYPGLVEWANPRFRIKLRVSEVRDMTREEIRRTLESAAEEMIDESDLSPLDRFLTPHYGERELSQWANNKFSTEFTAQDFVGLEQREEAIDIIMNEARHSYARREIEYPCDFAMDMTAAGLQSDPNRAISQFLHWVNTKYKADWTPETLAGKRPGEIREMLLQEAGKWDDARIAGQARELASGAKTADDLDQAIQQSYNVPLSSDERQAIDGGASPLDVAEEKVSRILRAELTQFERWILLQIFDQAWKDHLYSMDQVKDAISFRAFSQRDPRIEYKQEGARLFNEMESNIRDRVTDLVFKAKMMPQAPAGARSREQQQAEGDGRQADEGRDAQPRTSPQPQSEQSAPRQPVQAAQSATAAAAAAMAERNQQDAQAAEQAGQGATSTVTQRSTETIGRNEPCPCGSGKKYKHCCGRRA